MVVTATSTAGALGQMAAPGTRLRERHESRPEPAQAVVDVEPRLTRTPRSLLNGVGVTATASPAAGPAAAVDGTAQGDAGPPRHHAVTRRAGGPVGSG
ncbi:hypothetical protein [Streptomyces sp. NPDC002172]